MVSGRYAWPCYVLRRVQGSGFRVYGLGFRGRLSAFLKSRATTQLAVQPEVLFL